MRFPTDRQSSAKNTGGKENLGVQLHRRLIMNRRVSRLVQIIDDLLPNEVDTLLDVGAGSGEIANALANKRPNLACHGVDVYVRPQTRIPIDAYDGSTLPFPDAHFDAVMAIDVLHHCEDPVEVLRECARVSRRWILIKDHVADSVVSRGLLSFMDWVGNRAHGVVLPYNYLSSAEWAVSQRSCNLKINRQLRHLALYPPPASWLFDAGLQVANLLEKEN